MRISSKRSYSRLYSAMILRTKPAHALWIYMDKKKTKTKNKKPGTGFPQVRIRSLEQQRAGDFHGV